MDLLVLLDIAVLPGSFETVVHRTFRQEKGIHMKVTTTVSCIRKVGEQKFLWGTGGSKFDVTNLDIPETVKPGVAVAVQIPKIAKADLGQKTVIAESVKPVRVASSSGVSTHDGGKKG